jgi:hypothetical protein
MTDPGTEAPRAEDAPAEETEAGPGSRLQQYRKRTEEWALALRDGAEQHAPPEVLSGLAASAKKLAQYLDGMAERARVKQAAEEEAPAPKPAEREPEPTEQAESASRSDGGS